jgi:hypothetical protein
MMAIVASTAGRRASPSLVVALLALVLGAIARSPAEEAAVAASTPAAQAERSLADGRWSDAAVILERLVVDEADDPAHWYALARARSRLGDPAGAMAALTGAIDRGWKARHLLASAVDLDPLRQVEGFAALPERIARHQARVALKKLERKHGPGLTYEIDDQERMIFATALDERSRAELRQRLKAQARVMRLGLFTHPPDHYLTVVIPARWANPRVTGHFYPPAFIDAATMGSSLRHEFTHALHYADQLARDQRHPVWLMEGLATLYEDVDIGDGVAEPRLVHGLWRLQAEVAAGKVHPFATILALEHRAFTSRHYAQAGAMLMQLHQAGLLAGFYQACTTTYAQDPSGRLAMEQVWAKPLEEIQRHWAEWVLALPPALPLPSGPRPSLGCSFLQRPDGVQIDGIAEDGPAARAGLLSGDVIVAAGGARIIDEQDLVPVVFTRAIGDGLEVEFRRGTTYRQGYLVIGRGSEQPPSAPDPR